MDFVLRASHAFLNTLVQVIENSPTRAGSYCQWMYYIKLGSISEMQSARFFVFEPLKNWACCTGRRLYNSDQLVINNILRSRLKALFSYSTNLLFLFRAFRFKNKRLLKNLITADQGCPRNFPGVGDVSYIKDLMTNEIVSNDFSCSIFGSYSYPIVKVGSVSCQY